MMRVLVRWSYGMITIMALLLSGCSKEAAVGPCTHTSGSEKRGDGGGLTDPSATSGGESTDPSAPEGDIEGDNGGISDDGNDESDNERSKKKPLPSN